MCVCVCTEINELAFRRHFEQCGTVEAVRLVRDPNSGMGKGFGYILFEVQRLKSCSSFDLVFSRSCDLRPPHFGALFSSVVPALCMRTHVHNAHPAAGLKKNLAMAAV